MRNCYQPRESLLDIGILRSEDATIVTVQHYRTAFNGAPYNAELLRCGATIDDCLPQKVWSLCRIGKSGSTVYPTMGLTSIFSSSRPGLSVMQSSATNVFWLIKPLKRKNAFSSRLYNQDIWASHTKKHTDRDLILPLHQVNLPESQVAIGSVYPHLPLLLIQLMMTLLTCYAACEPF